jgi:hypothetical protein
VNGHGYAILGYVVGLGLLWGYALTLWLAARRRDERDSPRPTRGAG